DENGNFAVRVKLQKLRAFLFFVGKSNSDAIPAEILFGQGNFYPVTIGRRRVMVKSDSHVSLRSCDFFNIAPTVLQYDSGCRLRDKTIPGFCRNDNKVAVSSLTVRTRVEKFTERCFKRPHRRIRNEQFFVPRSKRRHGRLFYK